MRFISLIVLALSFSMGTASAATVTVETDSAEITVGERFEIRVVIDKDVGEIVSGFLLDLVIGADVSLVDAIFTDAATGLDQLNLPGGTETGDSFTATGPGSLQAFSVSSNTDAQLFAAQADSFTLVTFGLVVSSAGSFDIGLTTVTSILGENFGALSVLFGDPLRLTALDADLSPVPAPGAVILFATGMSLVLRGRRRMTSKAG